jgi:hypothetical protein
MSNIIVKGNFPTNLIKGYATKFYGELDMGEDHYKKLFEQLSSERSFELDVLTDNFTVIPVKPEATNITYQTASQQFTTTYNHTSFGGGFQISKEAKDDGKEMDLMKKYMRNLGFAAKRTNEIRGANVYLRAFNSAYLGGDGVQLVATTHPTKAGNQANTLANQVALSEAALEDLTKLVYKAKDYNGNIAQIRTRQFVVGPDLIHEATRLTATPLRVATANNDINAMKYLNDLPEVVMNPYFESSKLYFLRTDCTDGLKFYDRTSPEFSMDSAFDAEVSKYKIFFRNTFYWTDFRGLYACGNV